MKSDCIIITLLGLLTSPLATKSAHAAYNSPPGLFSTAFEQNHLKPSSADLQLDHQINEIRGLHLPKGIIQDTAQLPCPLPCISWQRVLGHCNHNRLNSAAKTEDGGYILGGYQGYYCVQNPTFQNFLVTKISSFGHVEWLKTYGGSSQDYVTSIEETTDSGFIVGGVSSSDISGEKTDTNRGGYDFWILKLNAEGIIEWQKTLGGSESDWQVKVTQTTDDGFLIGGFSSSGISGDKSEPNLGGMDFWILKLSAVGAIQWQNTIGGDLGDELNAISQTKDGGYILGGASSSGISGDKIHENRGHADYWIVKLKSDGSIDWQRTIGGAGRDVLTSISEIDSGQFIIGGYSWSGITGEKTEESAGGIDYWILKLITPDSILWQRSLGGEENEFLTSISHANDGGFLVGGHSNSDSSGYKLENSRGDSDYWIVKLTELGELVWQKTIGGDSLDNLVAVFEKELGGVFAIGNSKSTISGDKTGPTPGNGIMWCVELDDDLNCSTCDLMLNSALGPGNSHYWLDESNWTLTHIPRSCEDVLIENNKNLQVDLGVTAECRVLEVELGAQFEVKYFSVLKVGLD